MRKIRGAFTLILMVPFLAGCYHHASQEQVKGCEDRGGQVVREAVPYESKAFNRVQKSGQVEYCDRDGTALEVHSPVITELKSGFFKDSRKNTRVYNECLAKHGVVHETKIDSENYFVCWRDGQFVQILD